MKKSNAKRVLTAALAGMMALSLAACGEQGGGNPAESQKSAAETTAPAQSQAAGGEESGADSTANRPEAVSEEDWAAMQNEPAFGLSLIHI